MIHLTRRRNLNNAEKLLWIILMVVTLGIADPAWLATRHQHLASLRRSNFFLRRSASVRREMNYTFGKRADSIQAASERRQIALQKEQAIAKLRYEYDRKQASARSEAARRALQNEEELKRQQIEDEARYT